MAGPRTSQRRSVEASTRGNPRERVLTAASELFTQQGIGRTGVDSLIARAGVAKATFYRYFPTKEDLVMAWLRDPRTRWFHRVRTLAEAEAGSPVERLARLFAAVAAWLEAGDYRGCPYLNSASELTDSRRRPAGVIREYLAEVGAYLEETARLAGCRDPAAVGRQVHTLLAGAISLGVANRTSMHVIAASQAALLLLR
jgi:AcrR family transcriptional regulator